MRGFTILVVSSLYIMMMPPFVMGFNWAFGDYIIAVSTNIVGRLNVILLSNVVCVIEFG